MIAFVEGDLMESRADMLVNAVNCVGVMGAGIALAFRQRYPDMFRDYQRVCRAGQLRPGRLHVWRSADGRRIVNLPTKRHWREPSRLADIEAGLVELRICIERFGPTCVALPALGCGRGGLDWGRIAPLIESKLADLETCILVHGPGTAGVLQAPKTMTEDTRPWEGGREG